MAGLIYFILIQLASNLKRENSDMGTKVCVRVCECAHICLCQFLARWYQVCPMPLSCSALSCKVTNNRKLPFPASPVSWFLARLDQWDCGQKEGRRWSAFSFVFASGTISSGGVYAIVQMASEQMQYISSFHLVISPSGLW